MEVCLSCKLSKAVKHDATEKRRCKTRFNTLERGTARINAGGAGEMTHQDVNCYLVNVSNSRGEVQPT